MCVFVTTTTNNGAKSKGKNPFWIKKATAEKKVLFDDDSDDDNDWDDDGNYEYHDHYRFFFFDFFVFAL